MILVSAGEIVVGKNDIGWAACLRAMESFDDMDQLKKTYKCKFALGDFENRYLIFENKEAYLAFMLQWG